jgi:peroxiredoxin (alkyl hydroperoxide reductase subunit C)
MEELIRLVDALQFNEEHGEVCPANWKKGDKGMTASPEGVAAYLAENADSLNFPSPLLTKGGLICL